MYDILALPGPENSETKAFGLNERVDVVGAALQPDVGVIWQAGRVVFSMAPTHTAPVLHR